MNTPLTFAYHFHNFSSWLEYSGQKKQFTIIMGAWKTIAFDTFRLLFSDSPTFWPFWVIGVSLILSQTHQRMLNAWSNLTYSCGCSLYPKSRPVLISNIHTSKDNKELIKISIKTQGINFVPSASSNHGGRVEIWKLVLKIHEVSRRKRGGQETTWREYE